MSDRLLSYDFWEKEDEQTQLAYLATITEADAHKFKRLPCTRFLRPLCRLHAKILTKSSSNLRMSNLTNC